MTIAYFCVVIAILIPLVAVGYAKFSKKGYNNHSPREFVEGLEGKAKRAHYAQLNSYETFPPFAVGVVVAHQLFAHQAVINALALTFVAARICYVFFYIFDKATWRTVAWSVGFIATISLFFIGI